MVTVRFNDYAYAKLRAARKPGQSFSDVILEWIPKKRTRGKVR